MKRKRLDRNLWGFEGYPHYQFRMDTDDFRGLVCFIHLIDKTKPISNEDFICWELPKAGKAPVCGGNGMSWMHLIPDGQSHLINAKYLPNNKISLWYVDVIDSIEYDKDGVAVFIDKYLDVCFTPQGDVIVDDRDELDEAYQLGIITKKQYDTALEEVDYILTTLCADIPKTEALCARILSHVQNRIETSEQPFLAKYKNNKK